jgi:hypothetical protein
MPSVVMRHSCKAPLHYTQTSVREDVQGVESLVVQGGPFTYGSYPDIDALFLQQATELDRQMCEAVLHKLQQMAHERMMFVPIWQLAIINSVGLRVAESSFGLIRDFPTPRRTKTSR